MKKYSSKLLEVSFKPLLIFAIVFVCLWPSKIQAQDTKVSLNLSQVNLSEVFKAIESTTDYKFIYKDKIVNNTGLVDLKTNNETLSSVLNRLFENFDIQYQLIGSQIVLTPKVKSDQTQNTPFSVNKSNQKLVVTGSVRDTNGMPLLSANVIEKGTLNGTVTNFDGEYEITLKNNQATLVFTYIGYVTQEIPVNGQSEINVSLKEDTAELEEVIVVGYGRKTKATITGAVDDIKTEEILQTKTANLANNLQGRIAGLTINTRGGEPGADQVDIRIRGIGTTGNSQPLFVIDGVPNRGSFERLNPNDIESISVLKDASAAIYGAQAANGVILVTTKRGKKGKPTISYDFNYSISQPTRRPELMNAYQYLTWVDEVNERNNRPQEFTDIIRQYRDGTIDRSQWGDTDWWGVATDEWTPQIQHAVNVSGGSENTQYFLSGQYLDQDAIYVGNAYGYKQYNIRSNIDSQIKNNLKLGFDLAGRFGNTERPTVSTDQLIRQIFVQRPFEFPYFDNGLIRKTSNGNPISLTNGDSGNRETKTKKFDSKFSLRWDLPFITEGLYVDTYATIDYYTTTRKDLSRPFDQWEFDEETGEFVNLRFQTGNVNLFQQFTEELNQLYHIKIGYDKTFGKHSISTFLAYEQFQQEGEFFFASRQNLITDALPFLFTGEDENQNNGGRGFQNARQNYFGRFNYNYDDKYLADITMRYDGSSNFAPGKRFGFFPAASFGWRVSKEDFFKSKLIDELKLRVSAGLLGNDRVNNFQFLQIYNVGNSYIFGEDPQRQNGLTPSTVPNPDITWETAQKYNFGIDFTLRKRIIDGTIDIFYERRSDILAPRNASIPVFAGLTLPDENIGETSNQGIEVQLNHQNRINDDFSYNIGGQFSYARSKIIFIDEAENIPEWQRRTGKPIDFILLYQADGIYNNQDEIDNSASFPDAIPGDVRIVDQNGDGVINEEDQILLDNSPTPRIVYGFNMGADYKNWSLNILFQGQAEAQTLYRPFDLNQQSQFYTERWRSELRTPNARFPGAFDTASSSFREVSTVWLRNNAFLRLRNVELSYTLNEKLIKPLGVSSCRFYMAANNPLIIFDNVGINDPESVSSTGWFYPQQFLISTGFSVTF